MSATPHNTLRPSIRRRIKDIICTLLCRPTRPPSPIQASSGWASDADLLPDPPLQSAPLTSAVKGDPVSEGSAQELPGEPSVGGNSAKGLDSPEPLEDLAPSVHEAMDTALELAPPLTFSIHEDPVVGLPPSNLPAAQLYPATPIGAQTPANDISADDIVQVHTPPSHLVDAPPADTYNHAFETTQECLANPPSAASSALSLATPVTPDVLEEEAIDSPLAIAAEESSLADGEVQGQRLYLTDVVITRDVVSDNDTAPLRLTALCLRGVGGAQEGEDLPLDETSPQSWTLNERILLLLVACGLHCVVKDEEGQEIGFVDLNEEDLYMSEDFVRPLVTHDSQLSLSMSWKTTHNMLETSRGNLSQSGVVESSINEQEASEMDIDDYYDEGWRLFESFHSTGNLNDINGSVCAYGRAIEIARAEGHVYLPSLLNNLGLSFSSRSSRTGNISEITEAIACQQEALRLTPEGHADWPTFLNDLGVSLYKRFRHTGDMSDITQAIYLQQEALQLTPEGHADQPTLINNLGMSLHDRFSHTGDMSDITQAIALKQEALRLTPDGHADRPGWLNNLGSSLHARFSHTGDMSDITQAIALQQEALRLTPEGHADRPTLINNLGLSLHARFRHTGDMSDVTQAITLQQEALRLTPEGHAEWPSQLNNLGSSLHARFRHTGDMSDVTQAIALQQEALRLTPEGHAERPSQLNNLGSSLHDRFGHTGDMSDVTQAITLQQESLQLTPEGHAVRPTRLNSLGLSLYDRFRHTGDMTDITQAIALQQEALQLSPKGHADRPRWLTNLGLAFESRFVNATNSTVDDLYSSLNYFKAATGDSTGAPTLRLQCALSWARLIEFYSPDSLDILIPFGLAIHFLTLLAGLERTLQSRHSQLQAVSETALQAAAAACRLAQSDQAVVWLEQGRCLVWSQLNGLRTPMDDLRKSDSRLAQRLAHVAKKLEVAGLTRTTMNPSIEMSEMISLEEAARSHSALAREWEELLSAARKLSGLETFLLPTPFSTLLGGLPEEGPIIIINCYQDRCDALALLCGADGPLHIPLPGLSLKKAQEYRCVLKDQLYANRIRVREATGGSDDRVEGRGVTQDWPDDVPPVHDVLQSLWLEVAKPVLGMLGYSRYDPSSISTPPRLWWCPTGVLSFLPIHAAGIYSGTASECVMDYVVSSCTPTVAAITNRVKLLPIDVTTSGLFLTSQPKAPHAAWIPGTTKEVDEVNAKAIEKGVRTLRREGDDISIEDCRRYMEEFSSVHLACHASQNASDPLNSRFLLHKGELSLLSIVQMNLKNADLAFLSACQTATGEEKLADEAVHLAAGMLAAGYRRVVATMWSIKDSHAPKVATDFYDYLWRNRDDETRGGFDGSLSAHALHHAVQQLRRRLGNSERDLLTWIPYVHFGY